MSTQSISIKANVPIDGFNSLKETLSKIKYSLNEMVEPLKEIGKYVKSLVGSASEVSSHFDVDTSGLETASNVIMGLAAAANVAAGIMAILATIPEPKVTKIAAAIVGVIAAVLTLISWLLTLDWSDIGEWSGGLWAGIVTGIEGAWEHICGIFNIAVSWINDNIIEPIGQFFSTLWEGISAAFKTGVDFIVAIFSPIVSWIFKNIITPIISIFNWAWGNISNAAKMVAGLISDIFISLVNVLRIFVIEPLTMFFTGLWNGIINGVQAVANAIRSVFTAVAAWINSSIVQPIGQFFASLWDGIRSGVQTAVDAIRTIFKSIVTWINNNVIQPIGQFFEGLWSGIRRGICGIVSGAINAMNVMIRGILIPFNAIIDGLNKIPGVSIRRLEFQISPLPSFSTGGFPAHGQMFIAREAGPELVGTIGSRSAVINNDQIVESVSAGVYRAMREALAGVSSSKGSTTEIKLYLDGKQITAAVERVQRERGLPLLNGGVTYGFA